MKADDAAAAEDLLREIETHTRIGPFTHVLALLGRFRAGNRVLVMTELMESKRRCSFFFEQYVPGGPGHCTADFFFYRFCVSPFIILLSLLMRAFAHLQKARC